MVYILKMNEFFRIRAITQKRLARVQFCEGSVRGRPWPGDNTSGRSLLPAWSCLWRRAPFLNAFGARRPLTLCVCMLARRISLCVEARTPASRERYGHLVLLSSVSAWPFQPRASHGCAGFHTWLGISRLKLFEAVKFNYASHATTHSNLTRLFLRRTMSTRHWSRVEMSPANTSTDGECD